MYQQNYYHLSTHVFEVCERELMHITDSTEGVGLFPFSFFSPSDLLFNPLGPRPATALSLQNPMRREVALSNDPGTQL